MVCLDGSAGRAASRHSLAAVEFVGAALRRSCAAVVELVGKLLRSRNKPRSSPNRRADSFFDAVAPTDLAARELTIAELRVEDSDLAFLAACENTKHFFGGRVSREGAEATAATNDLARSALYNASRGLGSLFV